MSDRNTRGTSKSYNESPGILKSILMILFIVFVVAVIFVGIYRRFFKKPVEDAPVLSDVYTKQLTDEQIYPMGSDNPIYTDLDTNDNYLQQLPDTIFEDTTRYFEYTNPQTDITYHIGITNDSNIPAPTDSFVLNPRISNTDKKYFIQVVEGDNSLFTNFNTEYTYDDIASLTDESTMFINMGGATLYETLSDSYYKSTISTNSDGSIDYGTVVYPLSSSENTDIMLRFFDIDTFDLEQVLIMRLVRTSDDYTSYAIESLDSGEIYRGTLSELETSIEQGSQLMSTIRKAVSAGSILEYYSGELTDPNNEIVISEGYSIPFGLLEDATYHATQKSYHNLLDRLPLTIISYNLDSSSFKELYFSYSPVYDTYTFEGYNIRQIPYGEDEYYYEDESYTDFIDESVVDAESIVDDAEPVIDVDTPFEDSNDTEQPIENLGSTEGYYYDSETGTYIEYPDSPMIGADVYEEDDFEADPSDTPSIP